MQGVMLQMKLRGVLRGASRGVCTPSRAQRTHLKCVRRVLTHLHQTLYSPGGIEPQPIKLEFTIYPAELWIYFWGRGRDGVCTPSRAHIYTPDAHIVSVHVCFGLNCVLEEGRAVVMCMHIRHVCRDVYSKGSPSSRACMSAHLHVLNFFFLNT